MASILLETENTRPRFGHVHGWPRITKGHSFMSWVIYLVPGMISTIT